MKTITFYSYKGGVGRTLALSNIAKRLTEFGKKVCVLDFDLEAPGVHVKLQNQISGVIDKGIVNYIFEFLQSGNIPTDISKYSKKLKSADDFYFIPAGNPDKSDYWMKLAQINWWKLFYEEQSEGIPFFLDLKEKIIQKFNPDYLLIDTRTGITELSAITISLLADSVVVLAANNKENLDGCKHVINSLAQSENNLFGKKKDVNFVLSRIPYPEKPDEKSKENALTAKIFSEFNDFKDNPNINIKSFNIIHSDRELELEESVKIGYEFEKNIVPIATEYLNLFNNLTENDFTDEERTRFNKIREGNQFLNRAIKEKNKEEALKLLNQAISLNSKNTEAYLLKAGIFMGLKKYEEAIDEYSKLIDPIKFLNSNQTAILMRAFAYFELENYDKTLKELNAYKRHFGSSFEIENLLLISKQKLYFKDSELIKEFDNLISKYPNQSNAYNLRSNYYRKKEDYEKALADIYFALELNTENAIAYSTLAEIKICQGETPEFYRNLELAVKYGFDTNLIFDEDVLSIYKTFFQEERFIKLLEKYEKYETIDKIKEFCINLNNS